jgi:hypothetical protein
MLHTAKEYPLAYTVFHLFRGIHYLKIRKKVVIVRIGRSGNMKENNGFGNNRATMKANLLKSLSRNIPCGTTKMK